MIIKIPITFAEDHDLVRELPSGTKIDSNKRYATYEVTRDELQAWISDAEFYADKNYWREATNGNHGDLLPLIKSAQRTIVCINDAVARNRYEY